jgi:hypothetical protein
MGWWRQVPGAPDTDLRPSLASGATRGRLATLFPGLPQGEVPMKCFVLSVLCAGLSVAASANALRETDDRPTEASVGSNLQQECCCGQPGASAAEQPGDKEKRQEFDGQKLLPKDALKKDGAHPLAIPDSKHKVLAVVKDGKIAHLEVTDPKGEKVKTHKRQEQRLGANGDIFLICFICWYDPWCGCWHCIFWPCGWLRD